MPAEKHTDIPSVVNTDAATPTNTYPPPYRMHRPDGEPVDVWACGTCGGLHGPAFAPVTIDGVVATREQKLEAIQEAADQCCKPTL